jgi:hypothetical protein
MSADESIKALKIYAEGFVESVRNKKGVTLDYSPSSLIVASNMVQEYHTVYKRASEANEPRTETMLIEATYQLTGYFGEVYRRHFGGTWIINDDPDDVLVQVGKAQFPLYRDAIDELKLGQPALVLRFPKIQEASKDFLRDAKSKADANASALPTSKSDSLPIAKEMEDASAITVRDVKAN